jgi:hypothetical protein
MTAQTLDAPGTVADTRHISAEITQVEIEAYKMLGALYSAEETSFYTRNNILVVLQAGLLAAVTALLSKVFDRGADAAAVLKQVSLSVLALCGVGVIGAVAWLFTIRRSSLITELLTEQLIQIERLAIGLRAEFRVFTRFEDGLTKPKNRFRPRNVRLSNIWTAVAFLFALIWGFLILLTASAAFREAIGITSS